MTRTRDVLRLAAALTTLLSGCSASHCADFDGGAADVGDAPEAALDAGCATGTGRLILGPITFQPLDGTAASLAAGHAMTVERYDEGRRLVRRTIERSSPAGYVDLGEVPAGRYYLALSTEWSVGAELSGTPGGCDTAPSTFGTWAICAPIEAFVDACARSIVPVALYSASGGP